MGSGWEVSIAMQVGKLLQNSPMLGRYWAQPGQKWARPRTVSRIRAAYSPTYKCMTRRHRAPRKFCPGRRVLRSLASWKRQGRVFLGPGAPFLGGMVSVDESALGNPRYSKKSILFLRRHFCPKLTRLPPFRTDEKGSLFAGNLGVLGGWGSSPGSFWGCARAILVNFGHFLSFLAIFC